MESPLIVMVDPLCIYNSVLTKKSQSARKRSAAHISNSTPALEWFPIECRKTKTKVIILWPITTDVNNTTSQSEFEFDEGKGVPPKHNWFWFGFPLVEKVT